MSCLSTIRLPSSKSCDSKRGTMKQSRLEEVGRTPIGVRQLAMLDGHPQASTIGTRLAAGRWRGNLAEYWTRVGNCTIEGRPLRDEPFRARTPFRCDYRLSKKFGEVLAVARALAVF